MKKNKRFKTVLIFILTFLSVILYYKANNYIFTETDDYLFCIKSEKNKEKCIGIKDLFYDEIDNIYYFPINKEFINEKIVIINNFYDEVYFNGNLIKTESDIRFDYKTNYEFKFIKEKNITTKNILLTPLPIMSVKTDNSIDREYVLSSLSLIDKFSIDNNYSLMSDVNIRTRGNASNLFDKKSYRLEFLERKRKGYKQKKIDMLGINEKDHWILDALYTDKSKIRNIFAFDIWNKIVLGSTDTNQITLSGDFIELYINNNYRGLYVIKEPVTRKKLNVIKTNLEDSGIVVKGINYVKPNWDIYPQTEIHAPFEIKYPNHKFLFENTWERILPKISSYFTDEFTYENINQSFEINNVIDYNLFIEIVLALDNASTKNLYFSMKNKNAKAIITPWDLDLSLGITWDEYAELFSSRTKAYNKSIISKLIDIKDEKLIKMFKERYTDIRKNIITEKWIDYQLNYYKDLLYYPSLRDSKRWYYYDIKEEIKYIRNFLVKRLKFLDNYMEDL